MTDLGEERSPDGFDIGDTSSLDQRVELIGLEEPFTLALVFSQWPCTVSDCAIWKASYSDIEAIIGEDERGVRSSEFGDRHLVRVGLFCKFGS